MVHNKSIQRNTRLYIGSPAITYHSFIYYTFKNVFADLQDKEGLLKMWLFKNDLQFIENSL